MSAESGNEAKLETSEVPTDDQSSSTDPHGGIEEADLTDGRTIKVSEGPKLDASNEQVSEADGEPRVEQEVKDCVEEQSTTTEAEMEEKPRRSTRSRTSKAEEKEKPPKKPETTTRRYMTRGKNSKAEQEDKNEDVKVTEQPADVMLDATEEEEEAEVDHPVAKQKPKRGRPRRNTRRTKKQTKKQRLSGPADQQVHDSVEDKTVEEDGEKIEDPPQLITIPSLDGPGQEMSVEEYSSLEKEERSESKDEMAGVQNGDNAVTSGSTAGEAAFSEAQIQVAGDEDASSGAEGSKLEVLEEQSLKEATNDVKRDEDALSGTEGSKLNIVNRVDGEEPFAEAEGPKQEVLEDDGPTAAANDLDVEEPLLGAEESNRAVLEERSPLPGGDKDVHKVLSGADGSRQEVLEEQSRKEASSQVGNVEEPSAGAEESNQEVSEEPSLTEDADEFKHVEVLSGADGSKLNVLEKQSLTQLAGDVNDDEEKSKMKIVEEFLSQFADENEVDLPSSEVTRPEALEEKIPGLSAADNEGSSATEESTQKVLEEQLAGDLPNVEQDPTVPGGTKQDVLEEPSPTQTAPSLKSVTEDLLPPEESVEMPAADTERKTDPDPREEMMEEKCGSFVAEVSRSFYLCVQMRGSTISRCVTSKDKLSTN